MGDSLVAARTFTDTANPLLERFLGDDRPDLKTMAAELKALKEQATPLRARSIMKAAQRAVDMITEAKTHSQTAASDINMALDADMRGHTGGARVDSALQSLWHLVKQYTQGLDEITQPARTVPPIPQSSPEPIGAERARPLMPSSLIDMAANQTKETDYDIPNGLSDDFAAIASAMATDRNISLYSGGSDPSDPRDAPSARQKTLFQTAQNTLVPILHLAREDGFRAALEKIAGVKPILLPETAAKIEPGGSDEYRSLESLMPNVTNAILSAARQMHKTVSVSYMVDGVSISEFQIPGLSRKLKAIAVELVRVSLEDRRTRRARGEAEGGHISITAKVDGPECHIAVDCTGREVDIKQVRIISEQIVSVSSHNGQSRIELKWPCHAPDAHKTLRKPRSHLTLPSRYDAAWPVREFAQ